MLNFILILLYLLLFSGGIAIIFQTAIEQTICSSIFLTTLILYIFSIFNQLQLGILACFAILLVIISVSIYRFFQEKLFIKNNFRIGGILFFLIFFIFSWTLNSGRLISYWDEFSHWGLVSKNIYFFNQLGIYPESTTLFKGYPPATALFQYFWNKLYGSFAEGNLFRALNIFNFSLLLPIFSYKKGSFSFLRAALQFCFIVILP